jgi:hypothetical protein
MEHRYQSQQGPQLVMNIAEELFVLIDMGIGLNKKLDKCS